MRVKGIYLVLILISRLVSAQVQEFKKYHSIPEEEIVLNIQYNSFIDLPDKMEMKPQSAGFDFYLMYPLVGKNYPLSLAAGMGFSVQNYKNNCYIIDTKDSLQFIKIPDTVNFRKNKFSTVYFDIPVEFRLRSRPLVKKRNVKIAFGFKIGYNIQKYTKYEGDDFYNLSGHDKIKFKRYKLNHFLPYRYGIFIRTGYGKFSATAYYSLTSILENDIRTLTPFSLGFSITLF